ncbi:hypothetical protein ACFQ7A_04810 [Streptomyces sp. NPDC056528]|uniref:hypothetical protein n=1 Tax=Streptomyces sp. NPDC056528 TaxID=3345854 RepID=UPI0036870843
MTTDTTPVRDSGAEPTEQELRDLAAEHNIAIPNRPALGLVRRSRYDDLADDLVAALVALAKAKADARHWQGRFDQAHDRAAEAELSAKAARAAYDTANERAGQAEAERDHFQRSHRAVCAERDELRDQLKQPRETEPAPQPPAGTPHRTHSAAELAQHLEDGCADCAATLPGQSRTFLVEVAHAARDAGQAVALLLLLQDLDRRNPVKKETP